MPSTRTPKRNVSERPKRTQRPNASNDVPFESDILRTLPDSPPMERPKDRATPKAARRIRLTPDVVAGLQPESHQYYVWDTRRTGFGVRVNASGTVAYVVKLNLPGKRSVWKTLDSKDLANADIEYHQLMVKFGRGEALDQRPFEALWQDAVDKFEKEHLQTVKPRTAVTYRSALKWIREAFRNRPVRTITYEDAWTFHKSLAHKPRTANVCMQLLGQICDRAEMWQPPMRDLNTNPMAMLQKIGWKPYFEPERQRPIVDQEMERLGAALCEMEREGEESVFTIAAVRLLFFMGRRLREVLGLRWDQIDLEARTIRWTDTKTGASSAPLNDATLLVLQSLPRLSYFNDDRELVEHPYVLPGKVVGEPIKYLTRFWKRLLAKAEVNDLWRHDLRHAHGNESANVGQNIQMTAALLGHKDFNSSGRYSKPGVDPRLEASQRVAGSLSNKLKGKK